MTADADVVRLETSRTPSHTSLPPLRERVQARLRLLERWRRDGVPPEYIGRLPESINDARMWNAPELGIYPIGSKSDYVRGHKEWGSEVIRIDNLRKALQVLYQPRQAKRSSRREATEAREEAEKKRILLEQMAKQWHEAREASASALREVSAAEAMYADLKMQYERVLRTLVHKEQEVSFLRKQIENLRR